jgi:hypothetical protein
VSGNTVLCTFIQLPCCPAPRLATVPKSSPAFAATGDNASTPASTAPVISDFLNSSSSYDPARDAPNLVH